MHNMERKITRDESYPQRKRTPSFSSSLLDAIYRSIDESKSNLDEDQQLGHFKDTTTYTPKQSKFTHNNYHRDRSQNKEKTNLHRTVMVEDWIEKQSSHSHSSNFLNSTSTSSESLFSSSETETIHKSKPKSEKKQHQQKPKREGQGGFARTKLRALKIYGELNQKVKQPISPGSRIASFLSSIFNSGNVKKAKMCYVGAVEDVTFEHTTKSPCFSSSASSFSRRSCMSKTKPTNGTKRTVRFYPVSVILGEDSQPCSHRYTYENDPSLLPLPSVRTITSMTKEVKNCVVAKDNGFVKGYQNSGKGNNNNKFGFRGFYDDGDGDEDDDDDALSYSSSDLFELDHLIGAARYQEELPVYETTNLETNKAIANGLRL
ncbi:protein BIG GRAIN 1-like A [Abrus precatorius]|uniref:Protein BIG GRAIN 1-like A n=1 Tax=Abrus precatorius TaxID=3816 RepID=A0A8B8K8F3_ABRPR|nr:protein BIG GRAIN 1-like A [Abrus precatorius]